MAQRHHQYISRRKIAAELPWSTGTRTASSRTGAEAGFAAFGGTRSLSHVTEPVAESEATLVHWVDEPEDHWRGPVPRPRARRERLILGTPYFVALPH
jgi:hypothetical protein